MSEGDKVSIELVGGPPWGFRLGGGADFGCPLEIAKLRKRSKAFSAGLAEGDVVEVIDHQDVSSKSHGDAMKIIELAGPTLYLQIIKGVGPSADPMSCSMMSGSMAGRQVDNGHMADGRVTTSDPAPTNATDSIGYHGDQQPVEATVIRSSREPSVSRTEPVRERSIPRSLTILPSSPAKVINSSELIRPTTSAAITEPWTVDVTSYQFANVNPAPSKPQLFVQPKQPPPTSPKPKFRAKSLPKEPASGQKGVCPVIASWGAPPTVPTLQSASSTGSPLPPQSTHLNQNNNMKSQTLPMFRVSKVNAKPQTWQPTTMHNIAYDHPKHSFNSFDVTSQQSSPASSSFKKHLEDQTESFFAPPAPPPSTSPPQHNNTSPAPSSIISPPSSIKPANHIPGMVNPLICDDSQGDFGANPLVKPNKKLYSDSAFYDSPSMTYPTIQEQVAMAKEISNFLESNNNKRSKGGRMFSKRKQKADEWAMDGQGQRKEIQPMAMYDSLSSGMPVFSMQRKEFGYNQVRHHPDPIKSRISAAELEQIQHNQDFLCKHDALPPNLAFDINHALSESQGKAGQFFEKRRQRAEKYIVDENNRKNWQPNSSQLGNQPNQSSNCELPVHSIAQPYMSPWEAAAKGNLELAYQDGPQPQQFLFQAPIQQPLNIITNQMPTTGDSQLNIKYKPVKPVKASLALDGYASTPSFSNTLPKRKTRLEMMLEDGSNNSSSFTFSPGQQHRSSLEHQHHRYPNQGMVSSPAISSNTYNQIPACSPATRASSTQSFTYQPSAVNTFTITSLKRPKDYMHSQQIGTRPNAAVSAF